MNTFVLIDHTHNHLALYTRNFYGKDTQTSTIGRRLSNYNVFWKQKDSQVSQQPYK